MGIYERFGVTPIINASGTVTRLGGALMDPLVLEAMNQAAAMSVAMDELQSAASDVIAGYTGAQAGLVTSGSAAALTLGTAAILTRLDLGRMEALPHLEAEPRHFLIARDQRSGYDHAVRAAGARLIEVGFNEIVSGAGVRRVEAWEYEAALDDRVAGIVYVKNPDSAPPLEAVIELAHERRLPVLVDAAGELPPRENLSEFIAAGADLVAFSGGKAIRGPQGTGILCGRRELIAAAFLQMLDMDDHFSLWSPPANLLDKSQLPGIPRHGIGRAMKVAKEDLIGLLVALELFANGTYDRQIEEQRRRWLERIAEQLRPLPVQCQLQQHGHCPPRLTLQLTTAKPAETAFAICQRLRQGLPRIFVGHGQLSDGALVINPTCLDAQQAQQVGDRLTAELESLAVDAPDGDLHNRL